MKKYFVLLIIAILSSSCVKDHGVGGEGRLYSFFPRKALFMGTSIGKQVVKYLYYGEAYIDYEFTTDSVVGKDEWILSIATTNCNPDSLQDLSLYLTTLDSPIPEVQGLLIKDYEKSYANRSGSSSSNGNPATIMVEIDYRTSPVTHLTIRSLKTPLFGKPAGELLNDFFTIIEYNPAVISSPNYKLIHSGYGYLNKKDPVELNEWISMRPLAQNYMYLAPNRPLTGLPLDVQFVVEMETDEGLVLRDTTRMFTITE